MKSLPATKMRWSSATEKNGELGDKVINFERVKGRNDLKDKDIYIIMTMFHPDEYFNLNTLGLFIERSDIIQMHYRDLLIQATGRNTGYRDSGRQTVVIHGRRLDRAGYFTNDALNSADPTAIREFAIYMAADKPWLNEKSGDDQCEGGQLRRLSSQ